MGCFDRMIKIIALLFFTVFFIIAINGSFSYWREGDGDLAIALAVMASFVFVLVLFVVMTFKPKQSKKSKPTTPQPKPSNTPQSSSIPLAILPDDHPVNIDHNDSQCPYCGESMNWKKKPSRRSQFACKHCSEDIYNERPLLYSNDYLTEDQAILDGFAQQLHHWVFTGITETTIPNIRRKLKKSGVEPVPATMICSLLIQAMEYAEKQKKREIQDIKRTFRGDPQSIKEMTSDAIGCSPEIDDLNDLMQEYCELIDELTKNSTKPN